MYFLSFLLFVANSAIFPRESLDKRYDWMKSDLTNEKYENFRVSEETLTQSCSEMLQQMAKDSSGAYTCGDRIHYLETKGYSDAQAYEELAKEFPTICVCDTPPSATEGDGGAVCVFDIDGTVLYPVDQNLAKAAVDACKDAGYKLAVNTAESQSECQHNKAALASIGLVVPDEVYTCLTNYDWGVSKSLNMRTISEYYGSPSHCTLLFDDTTGNVDAVRKSGWLGQYVHQSMNGISPGELQSALSQLEDCKSSPSPYPPTPTPDPQPSDCTGSGNDPWASGSYKDCCSGLKSCLKKWDNNRDPYYKCEPAGTSGCYNEADELTRRLHKL